MIKGLTHDVETGVRVRVAKYKGKISTGYGPMEPPNKTNSPVACGFFRMLKEVVRQSRATSGTAAQKMIKEWVLNEQIQALLEQTNNGNKQPRKLQFMSLYKDPSEMWESSLAMYGGDGLLCKSHGEGTEAKHLTFGPDGERIWKPREFNGVKGCIYQLCPDFISGKCKQTGLMKVHPLVDMDPNPYRFETRSISSVIGIESQIEDLYALSRASHMVRNQELEGKLPFDGLFGARLELRHRKIRSGGRDVFITDLVPSPEFAASLMEPIKRGIERNNTAALTSNGISVSLLQSATSAMLEDHSGDYSEIIDDPMDLSVEDEQSIAVQFGGVEPAAPAVEQSPSAAETKLLDGE
jgi:hypothetical protein